MENSFTKNTCIIHIDCDRLIQYEKGKEKELNLLAEKLIK